MVVSYTFVVCLVCAGAYMVIERGLYSRQIRVGREVMFTLVPEGLINPLELLMF